MFFIFGVDGITKYHNATTDLPFFHHELFHMYHAQFVNSGAHLYDAVRGEGMATYVSDVLNPTADWKGLMLDIPEGLVPECDRKIEFLVKDLLAKLNSTADVDYTTYFLMKSTDSNIPKRAAYYVGYLVAKELNKTTPLDELIKLQDDSLQFKVWDALTKILANTKRSHGMTFPSEKSSALHKK